MNEIIRNLQTEIYDPLINEYFLSQEDFPEVRRMQKLLANEDFANFEDLDEEMLGHRGLDGSWHRRMESRPAWK